MNLKFLVVEYILYRMKLLGIILSFLSLLAMLAYYGPVFAILMGVLSIGLVLVISVKTW